MTSGFFYIYLIRKEFIFLVSDQTFPLKNESRIIWTTFNDPLIFLVIGITLAQCLRQKLFHLKNFKVTGRQKEFIFSTINPIVSTPHPPCRPPFLKEWVNFDYFPRRGRIWKIRGGSMGGWRGETLFLFNFFKVYHFYI